MTSLARMSEASLRTVIRTEPERRAAAWSELRFRNAAKQAWNRENGNTPPKTFKRITSIEVGLREVGLREVPSGVPGVVAFEGGGPTAPDIGFRGPSIHQLMRDLGVKPWNPPDLSEPEPPREGPMV